MIQANPSPAQSKIMHQGSILQQRKQETLEIHNLNKHTSFVFTATVHNVVMFQSFKKYQKPIENEKTKEEWDTFKKTQWDQIKVTKETKLIEYVATGGADKNIYLWELDSIDQAEERKNKIVQLKQDKDYLKVEDNSQQGEDDQKEREFKDEQLQFGHFIVDKQINHYEYITCLLSVQLDNIHSYLIAGYENNEYWLTGAGVLRNCVATQLAQPLAQHNDSVTALSYINKFLFSSGEDMQVLQQDINGNLLARFYFDSVVSTLTPFFVQSEESRLNHQVEFPDSLLFMYQSIKEHEVQIKQQQGQEANKEDVEEKVEYSIENYLMVMRQKKNEIENENENEYFRIHIPDLSSERGNSIENIFNSSDQITCYKIRTENLKQSITYGTSNGVLGRIPFNLERDQQQVKTDTYQKKENQLQLIDANYKYYSYTTKVVRVFEYGKEISALQWVENQLFVILKVLNGAELCILNEGYEQKATRSFKFHFLLTEVKVYEDKDNIGEPYQVQLQNLLYLPKKKISVVCGDMLRYFNNPQI